MKKNLKLFGSLLALCFALIACEKNDQGLKPEFSDLKNANNGMLKSYDNAFVLKWNEALSLEIDNKMPPASEARIYVILTLAVHDALNNVVPKYETYALDNSGIDSKGISKKNIHSIAHAAVAQAAHDAMVALVSASAANAASLLTASLTEIYDSDPDGIPLLPDFLLSPCIWAILLKNNAQNHDP